MRWTKSSRSSMLASKGTAPNGHNPRSYRQGLSLLSAISWKSLEFKTLVTQRMVNMSDTLFSVKDQVVLVSGASRGIGRAVAQGFAQRGAKVIITGRDRAVLEQTAREIAPEGTKVRPVVCDVAKKADIERLVQTVIAQFGQIDTLLNVAGVNRRMPAEQFREDDYDF